MLGFSTAYTFSLSAALPSMCVFGNFPPFLKITFTLSNTTQITRIMTVINNVVKHFLYICGRKYKSLSDLEVCF